MVCTIAKEFTFKPSIETRLWRLCGEWLIVIKPSNFFYIYYMCFCWLTVQSTIQSDYSDISYPQSLGDGGVASRELQCQHEGGQCEFFVLCWMSSGLLQGSCGGFMRGCCHRTAKSANLGTSDLSNTVDLTNIPNKDYGPVSNDPSESFFTFLPLYLFYHIYTLLLFKTPYVKLCYIVM